MADRAGRRRIRAYSRAAGQNVGILAVGKALEAESQLGQRRAIDLGLVVSDNAQHGLSNRELPIDELQVVVAGAQGPVRHCDDIGTAGHRTVGLGGGRQVRRAGEDIGRVATGKTAVADCEHRVGGAIRAAEIVSRYSQSGPAHG